MSIPIRLPNFVPGIGNPNAKIMIVGEAPGADEDNLKKPFVGPSGKILTECLFEAGISRTQCWVTNVVKYRPPNNDLHRLHEVGVDYEAQIAALREEIYNINPNVIVAVGNTPLSVLTGKTKQKINKKTGRVEETGITLYRGSILKCQWSDHKVIPIFHPAGLLHAEGHGAGKYWQKYIIIEDLKRVAIEAANRIIDLPQRNLMIARSSLDVHRFLRKYPASQHPNMTCDIETIRSVPGCVGFAPSPHEALSIPLFQSLFDIQLTTIPHSDLAECWKMIDIILREYNIIGQNFKFDHDKLHKLGFRILKFLADTSHMAHTCYSELPKNQAFLTSYYTREPYYKDEGKEFNPKRDHIDRWYLYNGKDCAVDYEIWERLNQELKDVGQYNFYYGFVRELHELYMGLEREGLRVDQEVRQLLSLKYNSMWDELQTELDGICGTHVNVNSPKAVPFLLYESFGFPRRKGADEETITALLANNCDKRPYEHKRALELILRIRQVRKTIGTYIEAEPDYDGRMRTSVNICGTETGRTSNKILKAPLRITQVGLAFQTMTKHGDVGADLRTMFIPDDGFVFVNIDQSQAEARVVALLSEDWDLLAKFGVIDIHSEMASIVLMLGQLGYQDIARRKKLGLDPPERFIGKTTRHAMNYDMGKHKGMITVNTDAKKYGIDVHVSEWKMGQMLDLAHAANPKIRGVFHKGVQETLKVNGRILMGPQGRRRQFFARWGDSLFKEAYAFIPQSTVSDLTKRAMLGIKKEMPDIRMILESHDAILTQMKHDEVADRCRVIKRHFEEELDFSQCSLKRGKLTIPADFEIGDNYKKLQPYKLAA